MERVHILIKTRSKGEMSEGERAKYMNRLVKIASKGEVGSEGRIIEVLEELALRWVMEGDREVLKEATSVNIGSLTIFGLCHLSVSRTVSDEEKRGRWGAGGECLGRGRVLRERERER